MICDRCGRQDGAHGVGVCPLEPRRLVHRRTLAADVTWPGGRTFENLGDQPMTFYSPAEQARYMRDHRIEPFVRHMPVPGSDKSPHTTSWASGLPQDYMDGVAAMLARVGSRGRDPEPQTYIESFTVTVTDVADRVRGSLT